MSTSSDVAYITPHALALVSCSKSQQTANAAFDLIKGVENVL